MIAAALVLTVLAGCGGTDAADQRVIDRLSRLAVLAVPAGATPLSRTETKGGGNTAIRTSSTVTVVYATSAAPDAVARAVHGQWDRTWHFVDNRGSAPGTWSALGGLRSEPGTTVTIEARPATGDAGLPAGTRSVVTMTAAATRP